MGPPFFLLVYDHYDTNWLTFFCFYLTLSHTYENQLLSLNLNLNPSFTISLLYTSDCLLPLSVLSLFLRSLNHLFIRTIVSLITYSKSYSSLSLHCISYLTHSRVSYHRMVFHMTGFYTPCQGTKTYVHAYVT
jgi:hypothetical protein